MPTDLVSSSLLWTTILSIEDRNASCTLLSTVATSTSLPSMSHKFFLTFFISTSESLAALRIFRINLVMSSVHYNSDRNVFASIFKIEAICSLVCLARKPLVLLFLFVNRKYNSFNSRNAPIIEIILLTTWTSKNVTMKIYYRVLTSVWTTVFWVDSSFEWFFWVDCRWQLQQGTSS